jgi:quinol-cytochrome oxidoreductase complex cytochrome b subunit
MGTSEEISYFIIRILTGLVLLSVWTWRFNRPTRFRGKQAKNMKEEFKVYGLSEKSMYVVGFLKIMIAIFFLCGSWAPSVIKPSAILLAVLMFGAVVHHLKVERDNYLKVAPAYFMLFFASYLVFA